MLGLSVWAYVLAAVSIRRGRLSLCFDSVQVEAHTKTSVDKVCCAPQNALKSKCLLQKYWQNMLILIANATKIERAERINVIRESREGFL